MDLDLTPTPSTSSADSGNETPPPPTQTQPIIPLSITNGAVKKTHRRPPPPPLVFTYRECMKNHAATLGGHAVDGCGEFMLSPYSTNSDPTSLTCAACGCHRNFHRRDPADASPTNVSTPPFLDFRHPAPPRRSSLSPSPPPQQHPYCQLAPHMLMTLSSAVAAEEQAHQAAPVTPISGNPIRRKRFRTKFSHEQKEKMQAFSEKLGWKMQGSDRAAMEEFCRGIGVAKGVLKVWMHNNKSTSGKKKMESGGVNINGEMENNINKENEENSNINGGHFQNEINGGVCFHASHYCSSRSH